MSCQVTSSDESEFDDTRDLSFSCIFVGSILYLLNSRVQISPRIFFACLSIQITDPRIVKNYREIHHTHDLITTELSLQFIINGKYFKDGAMRVKCVATISPVLWRGNKEKFVQWKPPPLIDNREAMFLGMLDKIFCINFLDCNLIVFDGCRFLYL